MPDSVPALRSERTKVFEESPTAVYRVLLLLCVAYFAKYFCTSCLYVVQALWQEAEDVSDQALSFMFICGYISSMAGKATAGVLADSWGGKNVLLVSCAGFILCVLAFAYTPQISEATGIRPFLLFCVVWTLNGYFALGLAWVAVVGVATNWIPTRYTGRLMGLVGMAPQAGDALARFCLAPVIDRTGSWSSVFQVAGLASVAMVAPMVVMVSEKPTHVGEEEAFNSNASKGGGEPKESFVSRVATLFKSPLMTLVCILSGSLYGVRTLFLLYATTYLSAVYCSGDKDMGACRTAPETLASTAQASMLFTVLGCVSVLLVGYLKDTLPKQHRASMLVCMLCMLLLALLTMYGRGTELPFMLATGLIGTVGFTLFGPYKVLGGAFAVDIGGQKLKATACSFMGISDNLAAAIMLYVKGYLGDDWAQMFFVLICLNFLALACASGTWFIDIKAVRVKVSQEALLPSTATITRRSTFLEHKDAQ